MIRVHRQFIVACYCGGRVGEERHPYQGAAEQTSFLAAAEGTNEADEVVGVVGCRDGDNPGGNRPASCQALP